MKHISDGAIDIKSKAILLKLVKKIPPAQKPSDQLQKQTSQRPNIKRAIHLPADNLALGRSIVWHSRYLLPWDVGPANVPVEGRQTHIRDDEDSAGVVGRPEPENIVRLDVSMTAVALLIRSLEVRVSGLMNGVDSGHDAGDLLGHPSHSGDVELPLRFVILPVLFERALGAGKEEVVFAAEFKGGEESDEMAVHQSAEPLEILELVVKGLLFLEGLFLAIGLLDDVAKRLEGEKLIVQVDGLQNSMESVAGRVNLDLADKAISAFSHRWG